MTSLRRVVQIIEEYRKILRSVSVHLDTRHSVVNRGGDSIGVGEEIGKRCRMMFEKEFVDAEEGILGQILGGMGSLLHSENDITIWEVQIGMALKDGIWIHLERGDGEFVPHRTIPYVALIVRRGGMRGGCYQYSLVLLAVSASDPNIDTDRAT